MTTQTPARPSRAAFTRRRFVDWLKERKTARLGEIIQEFNLEEARSLRYRVGDRLPRSFAEVIAYKEVACQTYGGLEPPRLFRALSYIVRLTEEREVYITSTGTEVMPRVA